MMQGYFRVPEAFSNTDLTEADLAEIEKFAVDVYATQCTGTRIYNNEKLIWIRKCNDDIQDAVLPAGVSIARLSQDEKIEAIIDEEGNELTAAYTQTNIIHEDADLYTFMPLDESGNEQSVFKVPLVTALTYMYFKYIT